MMKDLEVYLPYLLGMLEHICLYFLSCFDALVLHFPAWHGEAVEEYYF